MNSFMDLLERVPRRTAEMTARAERSAREGQVIAEANMEPAIRIERTT